MVLVRHVEVNDREDHENKRLQQHDQEVEHRPHPLQCTAEKAEYPTSAVHERDEDENHLTRIKISEQTQGQGNRFREQRDPFQKQVDRKHPLGERLEGELAEKSAGAFDLEAVVDHQAEYRKRQAEGRIRVGGGHC